MIGSSLGGAAALLAQPPLEVNGMILEAVYPSVERAISNRISMRLGQKGRLLAPLLLWQLKPRLGINSNQLRPADAASKVSVPKLFISGSRDQHTTLEDTNSLFAVAKAPKELWIIEGAGHVDLFSFAKKDYEKRILDFLQKTLNQPASEK